MEFKITETPKYRGLISSQSSIIELAKVEALQKIAEQLERLNAQLDDLTEISPIDTDVKMVRVVQK